MTSSKIRVRKLRVHVGRLRTRIQAIKPRVKIVNIQVESENSEFKIWNFTSYNNFEFILLSLDFNAPGLLNLGLIRDNQEVAKVLHTPQKEFEKSQYYHSITITF